MDNDWSGCISNLKDLTIFIENPWLDANIDVFDCEGKSVTVYRKDSLNYFYVTDTEFAQLYFEDGTLYCQDSIGIDCRSNYDLTEIIDGWNCDGVTSVDESDFIDDYGEIIVYPNPSEGVINIEGLTQNSLVGVYDIRGQLVFETKIDGDGKVDLGTLSSGMYLLVFSSETQSIIRKVVKSE